MVKTNESLEAEDAVLSGAVVAAASPGFTGLGYADYVNSLGDYIEWTVNTATVGVYTLKFRFANGSTSNRPLQLRVNGVIINATLDFLSTGNWTTWTVSSSNANLIAGINKIRLTTIGLNGSIVDNLSVVAFTPTLEAEEAVLSGAVVASASAGFTGLGYADYVQSAGDYIEWKANILDAGLYSLKFRYANGSTTNRPLKLRVNGEVVNASVNFSQTGSWTSWSASSATANLFAGSNTIRLTSIGLNGPNVDNLTLSNNSATQAKQSFASGKRIFPNLTIILKASVSPNPVTHIAKLTISTSSGLPVNIRLVDVLGRNYKSFKLIVKGSSTLDIPVSDLASGTYTILLNQGNVSMHARLVVIGRK